MPLLCGMGNAMYMCRMSVAERRMRKAVRALDADRE
jgi:hypothetical protein